MDATELAYAGAARQARLIAAGDVSAREVVRATLDRIDRLDPDLAAYRVVLADRALAEADQADARRRAGDTRPLLGVPVAIKDDTDVRGVPTMRGTHASDPAPRPDDAEVVRRLRAAGAVIVGKTSVPELMIWPFTEPPDFPPSRNPWSRDHTPGGSSGGSGAAVAAGLCGVALGTDGAGSIRIPAAFCGVFGIKPQRGRVPLDGGASDGWHQLNHVGPIARTVADAALFLDAVADDPPAGGWAAAAVPAPGRLRIVVSTKIPPGVATRLGREQRAAVESTADLLRSLGHEVVEREIAYGATGGAVVIARYLAGIHDEAAALAHPERLHPRTRAMAKRGGMLPAGALARARAASPALSTRVNTVLATADAILLPGPSGPPFRVGALDGRGATRTLNAAVSRVPYYGAFNATGQPACSIPAGFDADGLPLAVQLAGRPHDEATLLALAAQIEDARPWADRRPAPVSEDLLAVAVEAARAAAAVLVARYEAPSGPEGLEAKSTPTDLVSAADREAEAAVLAVLERHRPDDGILGEEGADVEGTTGLRWVVDPLDGTINYLLGLPEWSVSIACENRVGVVLHPLRDDLYTVEAGGPALLNGAPITATAKTDLAAAVVATGFAYDAGVRARQAEIVARVIPRVADIRRVGSAALDLAWAAAGRVDAMYEHGGSAWDVAAGRMLCAAVGLDVRDLPARDGLPPGTLVAPPAFADALFEIVR